MSLWRHHSMTAVAAATVQPSPPTAQAPTVDWRVTVGQQVVSALTSNVLSDAAFVHLNNWRDDGGTLVRSACGRSTVCGTSGCAASLFALAGADLSAFEQHATRGYELWPEARRSVVPYFRDYASADGYTQVAVVLFTERGIPRGVAGLERRAASGPFSGAELGVLSSLAPLLATTIAAREAEQESARRSAAFRAIGRVSGTLVVVDRDARRIIAAYVGSGAPTSMHDLQPIEAHLVAAIDWILRAENHPAGSASPPRIPNVRIVSVAEIADEEAFGMGRFGALHVAFGVAESGPGRDELSPREREMTRMLVEGYSVPNIAARCELSENTVRSHMRRIHLKLGVYNRADLVRAVIGNPLLVGRLSAGPS